MSMMYTYVSRVYDDDLVIADDLGTEGLIVGSQLLA